MYLTKMRAKEKLKPGKKIISSAIFSLYIRVVCVFLLLLLSGARIFSRAISSRRGALGSSELISSNSPPHLYMCIIWCVSII